METQVVDGLQVVWGDLPGPFRATLMFRAGRRDETFVSGGITHLVEHLVMASLPEDHLDRNASVDHGITSFYATGPVDDVWRFLHGVSAALCDIPTDRLATEASVLGAEGGNVTDPISAHLLTLRFGARGIGLVGMAEPAIAQITAEQVRDFARTWFVRSNAALVLSNPPPTDWSLDLPTGPKPVRLVVEPRRITPRIEPHPDEVGAGLAVVGPQSPAFEAAGRIMVDRAYADLRQTRGISYHVDTAAAAIDGERLIMTVIADGQPKDSLSVARGLIKIARDLATEGPTEDELDHDRERTRYQTKDAELEFEFFEATASRLINNVAPPNPAKIISEVEALTLTEIRATWAAAVAEMMILVPDHLDPKDFDLPAEDEPPSDLPVYGTRYGRKLISAAPLGSQLIIGPDGVSLTVKGHTQTALYDDLVGLAHNKEYLELIRSDGDDVYLRARDWKDGTAARAAVEAAVPRELWFYRDPEDD